MLRALVACHCLAFFFISAAFSHKSADKSFSWYIHVLLLTVQNSHILTAMYWITLLMLFAWTFFTATMSKISICTIIFTVYTPWPDASCNKNWKNRLYALLHVHVSNYSSSFGSVLLPYDNWKITETTKDSQQLDNQIGWNFYGTILFMEIDKNIYHKFGWWSVFLQHLC